MKKYKIFMIMLVLIMTVFLTAGCGNADGGAQTETQTATHADAAGAAQDAADQYNDGDIGADAVKAIVLGKVEGAAESDIYELETEYDDGRLEYEGSLHYGGYEYEFEIDAATGNILAWEIDD